MHPAEAYADVIFGHKEPQVEAGQVAILHAMQRPLWCVEVFLDWFLLFYISSSPIFENIKSLCNAKYKTGVDED